MTKVKFLIAFIGFMMLALIFGYQAMATVYPSYNNESDCRGCHGTDVSTRHHHLVANGTFQCTDCHPIIFDNISQTYYPQTIRDCLVCHPNKNHTNVHHILASQGLFVCQDCHPVVFDNQTQSYTPVVTWDCPVCHSTVLSIQNITPTPTPTPTPTNNTPIITNFSPVSPVVNIVGDNRTFNIATDQIVNATWAINGSIVKSESNINESSYVNTSASLGLWNVSVIASNDNGTVAYYWSWNVSETIIEPPIMIAYPSVIGYTPNTSTVSNVEGTNMKFGVAIDQIANISWYLNNSLVQSINNVNGSTYENSTASPGMYNVSVVATNSNGSASQSWTWNVMPLIPPTITGFYPNTTVINNSVGDSRLFNITTDQLVNVSWTINGSQVKSDSNVLDSNYSNMSAVLGTWNVSAIASNSNGSVSQSWTWNVMPLNPPTTLIDPPNGLNNWYKTNTVYLNVTDSYGIRYTNYSVDGGAWQSNPGTGVNLKTPVTLSDGIHSIQYFSVDNLGTTETTKTQSVKIDTTPPQITITSPVNGSTYIINQNLIAIWNAGDTTSGVASVTGTYTNGSVIDTSSPGTKNFSVQATDNAGNTNIMNITYYIHFHFGEFLDPINNDGSSVFKLGQTVPVKFQLTSANGTYITYATVRFSISKITTTITGTIVEPYITGNGTDGTYFVYETNGNKYSYNLLTKSMSVGTWRIRADITNDNSSYSVNISLKK